MKNPLLHIDTHKVVDYITLVKNCKVLDPMSYEEREYLIMSLKYILLFTIDGCDISKKNIVNGMTTDYTFPNRFNRFVSRIDTDENGKPLLNDIITFSKEMLNYQLTHAVDKIVLDYIEMNSLKVC